MALQVTRQPDASTRAPEPLADHRQADNREGRLAETARQRDGDEQQRGASHLAHREDDQAKREREGGDDNAGALAVDQVAHAERKCRTHQRGEQVDLRVADA
jgi:hypothetical protein